MKAKHMWPRARQYLITGVLTVIPIWITWVIVRFILDILQTFGTPWVRAISQALQPEIPVLARWVLEPWFQSALAIILALVILYLLGWLASRVVGRRLVATFDSLIDRIPLVKTIYGGTKRLIGALQHKPDGVQRVVLIEFPTPEMKTVGLVTRTFRDVDTGEELAAVYVPTTPNPTSGYLEIVPVSRMVSTGWTMDEAMTFIISGGAVAPEEIHYAQSAPDAPPISEITPAAPMGQPSPQRTTQPAAPETEPSDKVS